MAVELVLRKELEFLARRNYDHPFDERDNNTYSVSAGVDVAVHPRIDISLLANADLSYASGADSTSFLLCFSPRQS